ncbi:MAG: ROK family protein [Planctomycetota bacterium]|nr:MAG: ROK family protein [Planctomycetota bacterium]
MTRSPSSGPRTLSVDIGGSGIKCCVLDADAAMLCERTRFDTPLEAPALDVLARIAALARELPAHERVSVGYPGVVRAGRVITSPNLPHPTWRGLELDRELARACGKPVRSINDADLQGLGAIEGRGVELVITLGTGLGSALFEDGRLGPHLELAHHEFERGCTYNERVGEAARKRAGAQKWQRRVQRAIEQLRVLTTFDRLYVGGGNARRLEFELGDDVRIVSNDTALVGGVRLWALAR